ncbi:hypothetical protein Pfo_025507 [Paulownia fortunei]|nr:hypothetical protein Pfo_025507 [Paulownia fortunei]
MNLWLQICTEIWGYLSFGNVKVNSLFNGKAALLNRIVQMHAVFVLTIASVGPRYGNGAERGSDPCGMTHTIRSYGCTCSRFN